jgi:hypothetical protein
MIAGLYLALAALIVGGMLATHHGSV